MNYDEWERYEAMTLAAEEQWHDDWFAALTVEHKTQLRAMIQDGIDAADRGELIDAEKVFAKLDE